MINVFEKLAPRYKRLVRRFALDVWKDRATKAHTKKFLEDADRFKRAYEKELTKHYRDEEIKIFPGTITAKANQWLADQVALAESIRVIARAKKAKMIAEEFDAMRKNESADVQKALDRIYLTKKDIEAGGSVYRVFSFAENLEAKAMQIGEESAFDLGREVNNAVFAANEDVFQWNTQGDHAVRWTHKRMAKRNFYFNDPPTTIDEYGNKHTGLCGTDFGCRCFSSKRGTGKVYRGFVADARSNSVTWAEAA